MRHDFYKDLGHFWLGYIRMLGHLQLSAHLPNFDHLLSERKVLGLSLTCYNWFLDIGTMTIESTPHPSIAYSSDLLYRDDWDVLMMHEY